jgi:cytochrome c5
MCRINCEEVSSPRLSGGDELLSGCFVARLTADGVRLFSRAVGRLIGVYLGDVRILAGRQVKEQNQMSKTRTIYAAFLMPLIIASLAACSTGSSQPTQAPTQASSPTTAVSTATSAGAAVLDGATLVDTRCTTCHTTDRIKQAHKTRDQWDQTVTNMINKGAQLTDAEKVALVDYLAKTYGS